MAWCLVNMNIEISTRLNQSAAAHKPAANNLWQNVESLVERLGYKRESAAPYLLELSKLLSDNWYRVYGELPQMQMWSFWSDESGDDYDEQLAYIEAPDIAHEWGDRIVAVYPEIAPVGQTIMSFLDSKGLTADLAKRVWWPHS